jgi:hypothetical protein
VTLVYLDVSALVKLVVAEHLRAWPQRVSSALSLTELPRALRRAGFGAAARCRARHVLARVSLVDVDRRILVLRSLAAIHLATALAVRADLAAVVTYDRRLRAAAEMVHLEVAAPAWLYLLA